MKLCCNEHTLRKETNELNEIRDAQFTPGIHHKHKYANLVHRNSNVVFFIFSYEHLGAIKSRTQYNSLFPV